MSTFLLSYDTIIYFVFVTVFISEAFTNSAFAYIYIYMCVCFCLFRLPLLHPQFPRLCPLLGQWAQPLRQTSGPPAPTQTWHPAWPRDCVVRQSALSWRTTNPPHSNRTAHCWRFQRRRLRSTTSVLACRRKTQRSSPGMQTCSCCASHIYWHVLP